MTPGKLPPEPPPPMRDVWLLFIGLIVSVPLAGFALLELPPVWKGGVLFALVVLLLVLVRRMMRSRFGSGKR